MVISAEREQVALSRFIGNHGHVSAKGNLAAQTRSGTSIFNASDDHEQLKDEWVLK
jgi:hypothetical protein